MATNKRLFQKAYERRLFQAMTKRPQDYALYSNVTVEFQAFERAQKMVNAIAAGQLVNVSPAMRQAAKDVGLPDTKQSTIAAFIKGA